MKHLSFALFCLSLTTLPALVARAGPWPQEEGKGLAIVTTHFPSRLDMLSKETEEHFYFEYGATDRLTIGLTGNYAYCSGDYEAVFFTTYPILSEKLPIRTSLHLGIGIDQDWGLPAKPITEIGLSFGKGFNWGWAVLDAKLQNRTDGHHKKIDATLGANFNEAFSAFVQVQADAPAQGSTSLNIAPTLKWQMTDNHGVSIGAVVPQGRQADPMITVGTWISF